MLPEVALFRMVGIVWNRVHLHFDLVPVVKKVFVFGTKPNVIEEITFMLMMVVVVAVAEVLWAQLLSCRVSLAGAIQRVCAQRNSAKHLEGATLYGAGAISHQ